MSVMFSPIFVADTKINFGYGGTLGGTISE